MAGLIGGHKEFVDATVQTQYLDKALNIVSSVRPTVYFDDYHDGTAYYTAKGYVGAGGGSAAQAAGNEAGGVYSLSSGATAASTATLNLGNAIGGSPLTKMIYCAHRVKVSTAINNTAICAAGLIASGGNTIAVGVFGSNSTANFVLQVNGALATGFVSTGVPVDTAWHVFEIWTDGKTYVWAKVDDKPSVKTRLTATYADTTLLLTARNGATAAARTLLTDWSLIVAQR